MAPDDLAAVLGAIQSLAQEIRALRTELDAIKAAVSRPSSDEGNPASGTKPSTHATGETIARSVYGLTDSEAIRVKTQRLSRLAKAGQIPGSFQEGTRWYYPWAFFAGTKPPEPRVERMPPRLRALLAERPPEQLPPGRRRGWHG
jgi:hypothetical protein